MVEALRLGDSEAQAAVMSAKRMIVKCFILGLQSNGHPTDNPTDRLESNGHSVSGANPQLSN